MGKEAKEVIGRTPGSIVAVKPLKNGVIADFETTTIMLQEFIRKALRGKTFTKARVIICVPSGVTTVERRAVKEAVEQAGAKYVLIVEEAMAAAIGAGLPMLEPIGMGGIISSKSIRCGGDELDAAIINHIRKRYNLLIGERTAEDIKIQIGSAFPMEREDAMEIKGRNLLNGLPETINITGSEVRDAMSEPLARIVDAIKYTLEQTPPDLSADIIDRGIILSGGGALLRGIDRLIHKETGMPVLVAEYPLDCVAEGTGKLFSNLERYQDAFMEDNRY